MYFLLPETDENVPSDSHQSIAHLGVRRFVPEVKRSGNYRGQMPNMISYPPLNKKLQSPGIIANMVGGYKF